MASLMRGGAVAMLLLVVSLGAARPAAASLKNALDDAVAAFPIAAGDKIKVSYAASSALAKQLESGAPADLFISADLDWMDYVEQR